MGRLKKSRAKQNSRKGGIYTLILGLEKSRALEVGGLGCISFTRGFYAYTGSAQVSFKRVLRHLKVAAGTNTTKRWHIDYLLPQTRPLAVILSPGKEEECLIAQRLAIDFPGVMGFGSSDCQCPSHLHWSRDFKRLKKAAISAHNTLPS